MAASLANALHVGGARARVLIVSLVLPSCGQYDDVSSTVPATDPSPLADPTEASNSDPQPNPPRDPQPVAEPSATQAPLDEPIATSDESTDFSWTECGRLESPHTDTGGEAHPQVRDLSISADGNLLLSNGHGTVAWQVAALFHESSVLWTTVGTPENGNVAVSADGRFASVSGDVRILFNAQTGEQILLPNRGTDAALGLSETLCLNVEFEFSPDVRWVAGKQYSTQVEVYDTETLELVKVLPTPSCGQGISFSPDGKRLATPEGIFSTDSWAPEGKLVPVPEGWHAYSPDLLEYATDGRLLLRTSCREEVCRSQLDGMPLTALDSPIRQRHLSRAGGWVVAGATLLHWSSGTVVTLPDAISAAIFAPNSDVIAGLEDGNLVRYCRSLKGF